jgi:hypothetical protein
MSRAVRLTIAAAVTAAVVAVVVAFVVAAVSTLGLADGLLVVAGVGAVVALLAWLTPLWAVAVMPDDVSSWLALLPALWRWALRDHPRV